MQCVPLLECTEINSISLEILKQDNRSKRHELFGKLRDKLCGDQLSKELFVCCPDDVSATTTTDEPPSHEELGEGIAGGNDKTQHRLHFALQNQLNMASFRTCLREIQAADISLCLW